MIFIIPFRAKKSAGSLPDNRHCRNCPNLQNLDIQDICTIFAALFTKESFVILIGGLLKPDKMTG